MDADDDDEEVVREIDLYLTDELNLYLLQFPLRPVYQDPVDISAAKFKPNHKILELDVPFTREAKKSFESQKDIPPAQKYISSAVAQTVVLGAGIIHNNAMHISPVNAVLQMRPTAKIYKRNVDSIEDMEDDVPDESKSKEEGLQQVRMKKKESDKAQSMRMQSYSFLQSQEELESWLPLTVHGIGEKISEFNKQHIGNDLYLSV